MGNLFNRVDCGTKKRNTGFGDCVLNLLLIKGGFYVPGTFLIPKDVLASPAATIAFLRAAANSDSKSQRIYPIHNFVNPTDNSDDLTKQTFSDGSESIVREGLIKWGFQIVRGGKSLHTALRTHNENGGYFIFYDATFTLFGLGIDREISGLPLNYKWMKPFKQNDGSKATEYMLEIAMNAEDVNDNLGFAKLTRNIEDVKGLRDVEIVVNEFDHDGGKANVSLLTLDSGYNLFDLYKTNFSVKTLWEATNSETGGDIAITSVDPAPGKTFDIQFNAQDSDYPVAADILLDLVPVSVLTEAGVEGFEGIEVILPVSGSF